MTKIYFLIALTTSLWGFAQNESEMKIVALNDTLSFTRWDYSKLGVTNLVINMYELTPETIGFKDNAKIILSKTPGILHTFYYFIELPQGKYSFNQKQELFNIVANSIVVFENELEADLYLNFDQDYSKLYRQNLSQYPEMNKIKKMILNINYDKLMQCLFMNK